MQGFFGALGFADVDHQAAQHWLVAVFDQADNVTYPQAAAISGDDPVINTVITVGTSFPIAIGLGAGQVSGMDDVAPEAWNQPMGAGIAKQVFGMGRHIAVGEVADACFPGDGGQALHQAAIVVLAASQFLLKGDPTGNFRAEPAIDPNDDRQHCTQQQHRWQAVREQVSPEGAVIGEAADPVLLDRISFG